MTGVTLGHPKAVYRERLECCTVEISVAALNVGIGHFVRAHGRPVWGNSMVGDFDVGFTASTFNQRIVTVDQ